MKILQEKFTKEEKRTVELLKRLNPELAVWAQMMFEKGVSVTTVQNILWNAHNELIRNL